MLIACATIVQSYMQIVTLPLGGIYQRYAADFEL